jgi:hypothetical protein
VASNNLSDLTNADTALGNLGGTTTGKALFKASTASSARTTLGASTIGDSIFTAPNSASARAALLIAPKGHLWGLTLSNNTTDPAADIDIAAGEAADADGNLMVLASTLTKKIDALWSVGNNGGRDTGSWVTGTWHLFLIQRSDTGVVDALFSLSATSPTMPTNYDRKRRIGSVICTPGTIVPFTQRGDYFLLKTSVTDYNATASQSWTLRALTVPTGIRVRPLLTGYVTLGSSVAALNFALADGDDASTPTAPLWFIKGMYASDGAFTTTDQIFTNTSAQIRLQTVFSGTASNVGFDTRGWIDTRGRFA